MNKNKIERERNVEINAKEKTKEKKIAKYVKGSYFIPVQNFATQ